MTPTRRSFLRGLGALLAAPAIVRAASLMPVSAGPLDLRMCWLHPTDKSDPLNQLRVIGWKLVRRDGVALWGNYVSITSPVELTTKHPLVHAALDLVTLQVADTRKQLFLPAPRSVTASARSGFDRDVETWMAEVVKARLPSARAA